MADDGLLRTSVPERAETPPPDSRDSGRADRLTTLFDQAAAEMERRGLTGLADGLEGPDGAALRAVAAAVLDAAADPVDCLMAAAAAGLFPAHQPPADLPGDDARNRYLLQHLERRGHRVRPACPADLPALVGLERRCWAPALRTPKAVLAGRIARDPQGQLALLVDGEVVGVIYSQRIPGVDELNGITVAQIDSLHDPDAAIVQLLAVNILPEMQHRALGDQLLEFMLIYRSLQPRVDAVVAITLCRDFDAQGELALEDYIRLRNAHGVLSDPILRFHELHGADVERVMPGYRPADRKNDGCGVLVRYDIRRRGRRALPLDAEPAGRSERPSRARIRADVQSAVCECLGRGRRTAFAFDRPLMEMGLDSADILELGEAIAQRYRLPLPPAFFFQYNTAEKIAGYLCERFAQDAPPPEAPPALLPTASAKATIRSRRAADGPSHAREQDVAIIGMACRLPGGIQSPEDLWEVLRNGTPVIGSLPADRWRWPEGIDPANRHRGIDRGGFLDDVAAFDASFFRVSPAEAESMDPQQRMLLELSWQAIEHAGYAAGTLAGSRTGVFVGASGSDYARLLDQSGLPAEAHYGTGSSMAVLANRISYFFNFLGPSLLIDTACSSSLVAVHEAVQAIRSGEAAQALVGGINLILHPANSVAYYRAGMLSKDGLCRTFDRQANGYVRSEGAVVLLLKPLRAALDDGDRIHAVIKGTACNHGGQASGLTVPNPEQQGRLLQAAWRAADVDPAALSYIEAHGTGTALGDPIEVQGLRLAFDEAMGEPAAAWRCGLGSVKTNLGHLEAAAGLAGLLKVVLSLRHGVLPASLHFRQRNDHIDLDGTGLYVVDRLQDWAPATGGGPRLAGVSSFGSGGTNAHAVLAEPPAVAEPSAVVQAPAAETGGPVLFVLSARTPQRLQAYARRYADWLGSPAGAQAPLGALARLLQTGRQAMEERLALVVSGRRELIEKLTEFCAGSPPAASGRKAAPDGLGELTRGDAGQAFVRALVAQGDLEGIAALWQAGADIDWSLLHGGGAVGGRVPRIEAPTYPFAASRHWLPNGASPPSGREAGATAAADAAPTLLAPVWRPFGAGDGAFRPSGTVLVAGAGEGQRPAIAAACPAVHWMDIDADAGIEALAERLRAFGDLDHVLWLAPPAAGGLDALVGHQRSGLLHLFRLVKALLRLGYGDRALGLTVATRGTQAVYEGEVPDPAHAGLHGFTGALAKECPRWSVRSLDLEDDAGGPEAAMAAPAMTGTADNGGEVLARRGGQWFRRVLSPVAALPDGPPAYRQNGVYVVIGGAGGIGEAWTRHAIAQAGAQVVWIGRRQPDAAIQAKLEALAQPGPAPVYIAADAADRDSLQAAHAAIKRRWPAVHGVIHAAVGVFDRSIAEMDEQRFREVLSVKIDASVHVAQVFGAEPLDFLLYFSSIVALEKNGGLSGYAAGGAFEDALALHLHGQRPYPVKVVNWGHWGVGTGATIADASKTRLQRSGYAPIQPAEGMAALQQLLSSPLRQMAVLKTSRLTAHPLYDGGQTLHVAADGVPGLAQLPPALERFGDQVEGLRPLSLFNNAALEAALLPLFAATLQALGLSGGDGGGDADGGVTGFHRHWLRAGRALLAERGAARPAADPACAWEAWERAKRNELNHDDLAAAIELVEACLRGLPDVLAGRTRATDIIFPNASMRRVEGVYRDNAAADYFNGLLAEALAAAVEERLRHDPAARLRILEVGAGTGGTTALVLPRLAAYGANIEEYAYTDVSKAFLFHAEERFAGAYPFVRPRLFDVERPLSDQGIAAQRYDMVIATNVLHATRNIHRTLATCKAALRKGGLLLLNEISTRSLFAHLTFGLLEGWWLSEDQPLRMPDSPGLYPERWRAVLGQAGFSPVFFPVPGAHALGQQVVVAQGDGVAWQATVPQSVAPQSAASRAGAKPPAPVAAPAVREETAATVPAGGEALKAAATLHLKALVARTLRMERDDIDEREPLEAYGIDSILVVQITNALREIFPDVPSTLLFECQTVDALTEHFLRNEPERLARLTGVAPQTRSAAAPAPAIMATAPPRSAGGAHPPVAQDAIAVIGMSCRFPQADTPDEFWQILKAGKNCVREVPAERWPLDGFFHPDPDEAVDQGKSYSKWGGFLDRVTEFDPLFFNIAPKEAAAIDPQERLFLQSAWEALEDAGYTRERLTREFRQQLGVFVGITRTGFDLFGPDLWRRGETIYPHTSFSSVANRLSYFLNARGPSVPVDTMCSSSLTAVHQACQSLRAGECELAIAGGVNVYLHPSGYVGLSAARMLSKDGACRSFGKGGNGFVPGEGVAALLLKPLSRAVADGDQIHAVIRATHVNHGGKTNGYTVPNPQAQAELVRDALRKAGIDARAVSYVEAHGTGTELGDPIEVAGLTKAFRDFTPDSGFCALGSAKSNIGHLEAAAGIAGVVKVILQMRHRQLAPSLHAAELNPNIDFSRTPFLVQRTLADWPRPSVVQQGAVREVPRIAGVSAFGAGGANAHVILEEHTDTRPAPAESPGGCVVVLSARNEERLKAYAGKLLAFLDRRMAAGDAPALADLAYTLQVGREAMEQRLGLVAGSFEELRDTLKAYLGGAYLGGSGGAAELFAGNVRDHKDVISAFAGDAAMQDTLAAWFREGKHGRLLKLWSKGLNVDWGRLYADTAVRPRCVSLPTYPFATTRYWLPVVAEPAESRPRAEAPAVTPPAVAASAAVRSAPAPSAPSAPPLAKPSGIVLRDPASVPTVFDAPSAPPRIALAPLACAAPPPAVASPAPPREDGAGLLLLDHGDGILSLEPAQADGRAGAAESAAALTACIDWINARTRETGPGVRQGGAPKVLLLNGLDRLFPGAGDGAVDGAAAALAGCAVPAIAVLTGDNRQDALRLAAACDLTVCSVEGTYAFPEADRPMNGAALRPAGFTLPVVPAAEAAGFALVAARAIARAPAATLSELKAHLARSTGGDAAAPLDTAGFVWTGQPPSIGAARRVALASEVVTLDAYSNGVAVVTLCDRAAKNTFSPAFVSGVIEAFEHIAATPDYKAVVLTGYDTYFACGGTRDGLLAIQSGKARFTDEQSYALPLACEIPVIAAMQGHGIGAGWAMGLFCDRAVYSEESVYQSPYMLYGFTPGAGSTLIFPQRLGPALAREVLFTAREFQGRELKRRGIAMPVLPRAAVPGYALALASHLAATDRQELVRRKAERCRSLRDRLPSVFAQELAMHDRTFVGNADVVANIDRYFNTGIGNTGIGGAPAVQSGAAPSGQSMQSVRESLRESLAEELLLKPEQLDLDASFIDLGMDSISAVTWVRKLNKQFGLSLNATKIYSHPDLTQFAELVLSQMGPQPVVPAEAPSEAPEPQAESAPEAAPESGEGESTDSGELLEWLRRTLAAELAVGPEALDDDAKFVDLGLDSVTAVTWIRGINKRFDLSIPAPKVYSHPTLAEFHRHLLTLVGGQGVARPSRAAEAARGPAVAEAPRPEPSPSAPPPAPVPVRVFPLAPAAPVAPATPVTAAPVAPATPRAEPEPKPAPEPTPQPQPSTAAGTAPPVIAIIGMSGQFPKADGVKRFWQNLVEGLDCVSEIPPTRWSIEDYYDPDRNAPGKTVCRKMGVLEGIDLFDPLFFSIAPAEAELMDPQQRLFLENAWRCIEDAGYDPAALSGSLCGVFVGCAASDYAQLFAGHPHSAQALIGESVAILPARIAYVLNLQGPCLAIDTACSASLVALANACDSLALGNSDLALAGGVYVLNGPDIHVKMSKAGMLSPSGHCFTFDQRADGFVPGEGVGVLLLKRLEDARRDGDDVYAVIRGWGVNQDGKTNGITAPNPESQIRLETGVYTRFGIDPGHIGLVEAHGTGTKLGDPIEVEALCESFRRFTSRRHYCALGSVKSNIGHLATAAGVTGVVKAALALQHRQMPPTINHDTLNEHIDLTDSPFFVNTRCRPWAVDPGRKRMAAVSSFGFSGTNAHMVLEEAERLPPAAQPQAAVLLPLSARSAGQLAALARAVHDHLTDDHLAAEHDPGSASLADIAYTYQVGRPAMAHRLAVVAGTVEELKDRLAAYAATGATGEGCWVGEAARKPAGAPLAGPEGTPTRQELAGLAQRWVAGERIDWPSLHRSGSARRRHGLPTYPFERERYWVTPLPAVADAPASASRPPAPDAAPDVAAWRHRALDEGIDWQARLRQRLGRRILVVHENEGHENEGHADEGVRRAFRDLLEPLAQAGGLGDALAIRWCTVAEAPAAAAAARPDCLLYLGGRNAGDLPAVVRDLADGGVPMVVLFVLADAAAAERLGDAFPARRCDALLVSQPGGGDLGEAMQRLFREWLAFAGPGVSEVHHDGAQRLCRAPRRRPASETIARIRKEWQPKAPQPAARAARRGTVLVLANPESRRIAGGLFRPGDFARVVLVADGGRPPGGADIDFRDPHAARLGAHMLMEEHDDITHVVDLLDLHDAPWDRDGDPSARAVFYQALVGAGADLAVLHVTSGLQPFRSARMSLAGARIAGLVKMLGADYRHVDARTIDIDDSVHADPARLGAILLSEFGAALQETELCYRDGQRFAPVLAARAMEDGAGAALRVAGDGVYVVSGGTSGVGLEIARHLAARGCRRLVLMGITPLPPRTEWARAVDDPTVPEAVRGRLRALIPLEKAVGRLEIYTGPLTDADALHRYFAGIRATLGPIRGVVHSAGVYSDAGNPGFANKTLCRMRAVWEPKADGLEILHAVFETDPLDFFVSFSSMTGLMPHLARGAGDYAMANAFVAFFSAYQHRRNGRRCVRTILWSDWNETGAITRVAPAMAATVTETFARMGLRTFSNREGCALFERALACEDGGEGDDGTVIIGYLDADRFEPARGRLLYADPAAVDSAVAPAAAAPIRVAPELAILPHLEQWEAEKRAGRPVAVERVAEVIGLDEIRALPPALIQRLHMAMFGSGGRADATGEAPGAVPDTARIIAGTVMEVLKLKSLDDSQPFQDYGLDSISAMVLATRLEKKLKQPIQPQWLIDFPTVEQLSLHLTAEQGNA